MNLPDASPNEKIDLALNRLEQQFGRQSRFSSKSPIHQLMATILSQRTNYENERKAFEQMWQRFGSWEGIMNAPTDELTEAIAPSNYPEVKAPRIKKILQQIYEERGNFDLQFLADLPIEEAMEWLMQFEGVGHKTTTFLLLFTFRKPVLPVDTHVHRVSQRLGIISQKTNQAKAHTVLLDLLPKDAPELLNYHKLFFKHGQQVCTWSYPRCRKCILTDICTYYHTSVAIKKTTVL
ncbi:MAG: endonuclease III [Cyclobacteriaceae bacterium]